MKKPSLSIMLAMGAVLLVAVVVNWAGALKRGGDVAKNAADKNYGKEISLRVCDLALESSQGPLVPDQEIIATETIPSGTKTDEGIPRNEWSDRAGFSISTPTDAEYWAGMIGSGWYLDWGVYTGSILAVVDHWQMIRVHEDCIYPSVETIKEAILLQPGQVWIIGNEPDVIWQDNVTAPAYAVTYHALYGLIKNTDPTALIAVGGISQPTVLRLEYLDQVIDTYRDLYQTRMPVDWWTVHGYVLREEKGSWGVDIPPGIGATQGELRSVSDHGRFDLFERQIRVFRGWMAENGYQNTPLALTEFGILMPASYGFPVESIADYLEQTFTWLYQTQDQQVGYPGDAFRLVQRWAWFSISDPTYSSSNIGDLSSGKLTLVGERLRQTITSMER